MEKTNKKGFLAWFTDNWKRKPLFSTGIAPLITDLMIRYPNADVVGFTAGGVLLSIAVGLFIGFFLPVYRFFPACGFGQCAEGPQGI